MRLSRSSRAVVGLGFLLSTVWSSVAVAEWASGDTSPIKVLEGASTQIGEAAGIAFDSSGRMYVANYTTGGSSDPHISVYASNWSDGDTPPIKVLRGPSTQLGTLRSIAFDSVGRMYVSNYFGNKIMVYAADWADGDTAPIKVLSGGATGLDWPYGIAFDSVGRMYVTNRFGNSVTVYAAGWADGAGGNVAPIKTLIGPATGLDGPQILAFDSAHRMYVTNNSVPPKVTMYPAGWADGAGGDLTPTKTLIGGSTGLSSPHGIAFDSDDRMHIVNTGTPKSVTVYQADWADGDTAPIKTLAGPNARIDSPWEIAFDAGDRLYLGNRETVNVYGDRPRRARRAPLSRQVTLDPAGGTCLDEYDRTERWTSNFIRSRFIPGPDDCRREGFVMVGWADVAEPGVVRDLPMAEDPADGTHRYVLSSSASLVVNWAPLPILPLVFTGGRGFFCESCGVWLVWDDPIDGSEVVLRGPSGSSICAEVYEFQTWNWCHVPSDVGGRFSLASRNSLAMSEELSIVIGQG